MGENEEMTATYGAGERRGGVAPGRGTSSRKKKRNHGWILSDDP